MNTFQKINNLIITQFREKLPSTLTQKEKQQFSKIIQDVINKAKNRTKIINIQKLMNMCVWLGYEELRFITRFLKINVFIIQLNCYGLVYPLDSGFFDPTIDKNLILAWNGVHFELITVKDKADYLPFNDPIIRCLYWLTTNATHMICQKELLFSIFYNACHANACPPIFQLHDLPKNEMIHHLQQQLENTEVEFERQIIQNRILKFQEVETFKYVKKLVQKFKTKGKKNITKALHKFIKNPKIFRFNPVIKRKEKIRYKLLPVTQLTKEWSEKTFANLKKCFPQSQLQGLSGEYMIENY